MSKLRYVYWIRCIDCGYKTGWVPYKWMIIFAWPFAVWHAWHCNLIIDDKAI